jgi:hypothetical protein
MTADFSMNQRLLLSIPGQAAISIRSTIGLQDSTSAQTWPFAMFCLLIFATTPGAGRCSRATNWLLPGNQNPDQQGFG